MAIKKVVIDEAKAKEEIQKIQKLTPEQEAKFPHYCNKWEAIGKNTDRSNRKEAERLIKIIYEQAGYEMPSVIKWYGSPHNLVKYNNIKEYDFCYGSMETWNSFYDFFVEEFNLECCQPIKPFIALANHIGWWMPFDDKVLCSEKPSIISMRDGRLHSETTPALAWEDGIEMFFLNGIRMKKEHVMTPAQQLHAKVILDEKNVEVRRELVRKIGVERMCRDLGAVSMDKKVIPISTPIIREMPQDILGAIVNDVGIPVNNHEHSMGECEYEVQNVEYELLSIDLKEPRKRIYLQMTNPSLNIPIIEGVSPDCKTVDDALAFRNGTDKLPKILS